MKKLHHDVSHIVAYDFALKTNNYTYDDLYQECMLCIIKTLQNKNLNLDKDHRNYLITVCRNHLVRLLKKPVDTPVGLTESRKIYIEKEYNDEIGVFINNLDDQNKYIFTEYLKGKTLKQIGDEVKLSSTWLRQKINKILESYKKEVYNE